MENTYKNQEQTRAKPDSRLDLSVGYICNGDCIFCMSNDDSELSKPRYAWVPKEEVLNNLREAEKNHVEMLSIIGGEPTIYPYLFDLLTEARKIGFKYISLITNGMQIADPFFAQKLIEYGVNRIGFSFHSHIKEIENQLCNRKKAYEKKLKAIENLINIKDYYAPELSISIETVINQLNYSTLSDGVLFFLNKGITDFHLSYIRIEGRAADRTDLTVPFPHLHSMVSKSIQHCKERNATIAFSGIPPCAYPGEIKKDPNVLLEYFQEIRNANIHAIFYRDIANLEKREVNFAHQRRYEFKKFLPICKPCLAKPICEGIWKNYLSIYGDEEFEPILNKEYRDANFAAIIETKTLKRSEDKPRDHWKKGTGQKSDRDAPSDSLDLSISPRCTNKCIMCPNVLLKMSPISTEDVLEQINKASAKGLTRVEFSALEPTLVKDLPDIIAHCKDIGVKEIHMVTNAQPLANKNLCKRLLQAGLTKVTISIHSPDPEIEAKITRNINALHHKIKGINNLLSYRNKSIQMLGRELFSIHINTVLTPYNSPILDEHLEFLYQLGLTHVNFFYPTISGHHETIFDEASPYFKDLTTPLTRCAEIASEKNINLNILDVPPCIAPEALQFIGYRRIKRLFLSPSEESKDHGHTTITRLNKTKRKECSQCRFFWMCEGVLELYVKKRGWEEFIPVA